MYPKKLITHYFMTERKHIFLFWMFMLLAFQSGAQDIFTTSRLHEIRITVAEKGWYDSLQKYYDKALTGARHQFVSVTVNIDGETLPEVGLRMKGKYSNYGFPGVKKPFRLDFNKFVSKQEFQGLKKLNLHNMAGDPSFLREFMAYDLFQYLGIAAPRASFAKLYINDVYWGCYGIVEEPDKTFLKRNFAEKKGNLFECVQSTNLGWHGNSPENYPQLELKTDSVVHSWNQLIQWMDLFNNHHGFDFQQQLSATFEVEKYFKILATDVLINNEDAYSSNGRNFFLYDNITSGKLNWIPWDYNLSFWNVSHAPVPEFGSKNEYRPLVYRILTNDYLHASYLKTFCKLLENEYRNYPFEQKSQAAFELIKAAVEADTNKFYTTEDFYKNRTEGVTVNMLRNFVPTDVYMPGLTKLFAKRKTELTKMIFNAGCDCSNLKEDENLRGIAFPNPATSTFVVYIEDDLKSDPAEVFITDITGNVVFREKMLPQTGSFHFNISDLAAGTYFVKIIAVNKSFTSKLIKQ